MLTMIHNNPARIENGRFVIDRKFHLGMQKYVESISAPLLTIHPEGDAGQKVMDAVQIPVEDLGYQVMTVKLDGAGQPLPQEQARMREAIAKSKLVTCYGLGVPQMARAAGVPYVMVLEYDLRTQLTVTTAPVKSPLRKAVRSARCIWRYVTDDTPSMRHAHSLHCNGYPIYEATERLNPQRLLYLDSRMSSDLVIGADELAQRLQRRGSGGPLRLLFSGRYEPLKGAVDAVKVAAECLRRGMDVEMHTYGQGSQRDEMRRIAELPANRGRIHVHDAIPYPELVERSKGFDVFVCCHIQGDPSCTYLESFGGGLPIVGYANRMWRGLQATSKAGFSSPMKQPERVADDVMKLAGDKALLERMSTQAREFALAHSYEHEFERRTKALNAALT
jgi:colanic acid/amylovoran biosynthesis glycosyltransferase